MFKVKMKKETKKRAPQTGLLETNSSLQTDGRKSSAASNRHQPLEGMYPNTRKK